MAGEYFFDLEEKLAVGAGAEYQLNRKSERHEILNGYILRKNLNIFQFML